LTFMPQLGIRLHQGLIAEGLLDLHLGLSRDIWARLHNNLRNQAAKRKTSSILISGLQHDIKNILARAEWQCHNDGIQELSLLLDQITPPDSRPEIVLDNLREQAVRGRKSIDSDFGRSLFTLRYSMKELHKIL
jgi:hypothetical protein